jgi:tripartite-type tricarboxylate transporter receptor subunit TctC
MASAGAIPIQPGPNLIWETDMTRHLRVAGWALLACFACLNSANADDGASFFAGKTLTVSAGLPPGGGVDAEMRVMTRHLSKFIPGHPTIISKNMPGAGGIVLANWLYTTAAPDGLNLGMPGRSGFLLSNVVPQDGIAYDLAKFSYVGSGGSLVNLLWFSKTTGIKTVADIKTAKKEIVFGALQPRAEDAIVPKVLAQYEKWPIKVVYGYPGFSEVLIAIERGEVDGCFTNETSIKNTRPDMITSGLVHPVAQSFAGPPNLPVLSDIASDPKEKALLGLLSTPSRIGLPLLGPPNIPADRLAVLRESYMKLMADQEYRDDAEKRGLPVGRPVGGEEMQKIIAASLQSVPQAVIKEYLAYTGTK